jgi:hypothetical protein
MLFPSLIVAQIDRVAAKLRAHTQEDDVPMRPYLEMQRIISEFLGTLGTVGFAAHSPCCRLCALPLAIRSSPNFPRSLGL